MRLADNNQLDPDRISFVKVLKHVRRSVIRQCVQTPAKLKAFLVSMAAKVGRKLDNGIRRLREADRVLKHPDSKYSSSIKSRGQPRRRPRKVTAKVITTEPATAAVA
jgi:hypothetical protein